MARITPAEAERRERQVRTLSEAGLSVVDIAAVMGLSTQTVIRYRNLRSRESCNKLRATCARCGAACKRESAMCAACREAVNTATRRAIVARYEAGVKIDDIARELGKSRESVHSALSKARRTGELKSYRRPNVICTHA